MSLCLNDGELVQRVLASTPEASLSAVVSSVRLSLSLSLYIYIYIHPNSPDNPDNHDNPDNPDNSHEYLYSFL